MGAVRLEDYLTWGFVALEGMFLVIAIVFAWLVVPALLGRDEATSRPRLGDLLRTPAVMLRTLLS